MASSPPDLLTESFLVVPAVRNGVAAPSGTASSPTSGPATADGRRASQLTKTAEELALENESLKANLDSLARQYQHLIDERVAEREALRDSVVNLGREVRREADRVAAAARQPPTLTVRSANRASPPMSSTADGPAGEPSSPDDRAHGKRGASTSPSKRIQELEVQLAASREEAALASATAAKYKARHPRSRRSAYGPLRCRAQGRYDQLRDAIKRKRALRDAETTAGGASSANAASDEPPG